MKSVVLNGVAGEGGMVRDSQRIFIENHDELVRTGGEKNPKRFSVLVVIIGLLMMTSLLNMGCIDLEDDDDDRIGVVVSIPPLKEFVERVAGDNARITVMISENQDPHSYEPLPSHMKYVARAELYFKVGSGVEFENTWMDELIDLNSDMLVVDGSEGVDLIPFGEYQEDIHHLAGELFRDGPFQLIQTTTNESEAPVIRDQETCFIVNFSNTSENSSQYMKFIPSSEGDFFLFLEHLPAELDLSIIDDLGNEIEPEDSHEGDRGEEEIDDEESGAECRDNEQDHEDEDNHNEEEPYQWEGNYHFHNETYTLRFNPGEPSTCKLVILENHSNEHSHEVEQTDSRGTRGEHDHSHGEGSLDPHIWLSPENAEIMVRNLLAGLIEIDPSNEENYTRNAEEYIVELQTLHKKMENGLSHFRDRKFIVYHPSFGYLAHEYHLEMMAIEEGGKEPTPRAMADLIDNIEYEDIRVIYISPQFDEDNARTIADHIDGEVLILDPLDRDYLENMNDILETLVKGFNLGGGGVR